MALKLTPNVVWKFTTEEVAQQHLSC